MNSVIKNYGENYARLPTAQDEYTFSRIAPDGNRQSFVICDVFLNAVFNAAKPTPAGWQEVLCEYHCNLYWLDKPWIANVPDLISVLKSVPTEDILNEPFGVEALRILPELLDFLAEGCKAGHQVILEKA